MKLKNTLLLLSILTAASSQAIELKSDEQKLSYALGLDMASSLQEFSSKEDIDMEALLAGMKDAYEGKERALSEEETSKVIEAFSQKQMKKLEELAQQQQQEMEKLGKIAKEEGAKFLAENKNKEGVKTTASGLQYKVEKEGSAEKPSADDVVTVHYTGKTLDGKVFDSSREENEPAVFPLDEVIAGWTEGLQLMGKGAKYTFYIPPELAYGEDGAGSDIPPHSTLIFDVELLDFKKDPAAKAEETLVEKASAEIAAKTEEAKAEVKAAAGEAKAEVKEAAEKVEAKAEALKEAASAEAKKDEGILNQAIEKVSEGAAAEKKEEGK